MRIKINRVFGNVDVEIFPKDTQDKKAHKEDERGIKFLTSPDLPFLASVGASFGSRFLGFFAVEALQVEYEIFWVVVKVTVI